MLFTRADRDGSGTIDWDEFEMGFEETVEHFRLQMEAETREDAMEHRFHESLVQVEKQLLTTIGEFSKKDFQRLTAWIKDPEDTMLLMSMYRFEHWNFARARAVLQLNLLHQNPDKFWECFCRVQVLLKEARLMIVHSDNAEDSKRMEMEIEEAMNEVMALCKPPSYVSSEQLEEEKFHLPMIRNMVGRQPGRGMPVRQWAKYNAAPFVERQREIGMPEPFYGRAESVLACIEAVRQCRLTTMVGGVGVGKTSVVRAMLHTLQQRALGQGGVYMYRDGVFIVDCSKLHSFERIHFAIGQELGLVVSSASELHYYMANCMMLLVLDGVHNLTKIDLARMQRIVTDLLDKSPGLTLFVTNRTAVSVPFENIMSLPPMDDKDLSKIVRDRCFTCQVHSGDILMRWLYGNPLVARFSAAMLWVVKTKEIVQIIELSWEKDKDTLHLPRGTDAWADGTKVWYTPDGEEYGSGLCARAWIQILLGYMWKAIPRCYDFVRTLRMVPAGLYRKEVDVMVHEGDFVLTTLCDRYGIVHVTDGRGNPIESHWEAARQGVGFYILDSTVAFMIDVTAIPMPHSSRTMLRTYLPAIDEQVTEINEMLEKSKTRKALQVLKRRENTIWMISDYDRMSTPDMFGDDPDALDTIGKLALFGSMVMMALFRLPEALLAAVNAGRFFARLYELELSMSAIKSRRKNPLLKVQGPTALGQALRLTGEIKLQMGANISAREDLERAFMLQKRVKKEIIAFRYGGSRLGQADVLWSLAEAQATEGKYRMAKQLASNCLTTYEDLQSTMGQAIARLLLCSLSAMEGDLVQADRSVNESVALFRELANPVRLAHALILRAEVAMSAANLARARTDLEEAEEICRAMQDLAGLGEVHKLQAESRIMLEDWFGSHEVLIDAKSCASRCGSVFLIGESERLMGETKTSMVPLGEFTPRFSDARAHLKLALESFQGIGYQLGIGNVHRATAFMYQKMGHPRHAVQSLLEALTIFEGMGHMMGVAVVKAAIGKIEVKKGNVAEGREFIDQATPVLRELQEQYKIAERKGLLEVAGTAGAAQRKLNQQRIEEDPFWKELLPTIDYKKAKMKNAGDVVRAIFGNSWSAGADPRRREITVGKTGIPHLDLAQVWTPAAGWQFSDEADHLAYDEIHWMNMDAAGRKQQASQLAAAKKRHESLLMFIGIRKGDPDSKIVEMAENAFDFFDDDSSGQLNMMELDQAFRKMGIVLTEKELTALVEEVDQDGDGMIDKQEFANMVLETISQMKEEDEQRTTPAQLDIVKQESQYRDALSAVQKQIQHAQSAATKRRIKSRSATPSANFDTDGSSRRLLGDPDAARRHLASGTFDSEGNMLSPYQSHTLLSPHSDQGSQYNSGVFHSREGSSGPSPHHSGINLTSGVTSSAPSPYRTPSRREPHHDPPGRPSVTAGPASAEDLVSWGGGEAAADGCCPTQASVL